MIDFNKIKSHFNMNDQTLVQMVNIFLASIENDFEVLDLSIKKKNFSDIKNYAHKLKGNFAYFLVDDIARKFEQIQIASAEQDIEKINNNFDKNILYNIKVSLEAYKKDNGS